MSLSESERLAQNVSEKVQTAMMANSARREFEDDHEMRVDLQHQLANSYTTSAPSFRKTWLESMAKIHLKNGDLSEAAFCLLHIAALQAECLRQKNAHRIPIRSYQKQIKTWIDSFDRLSPNITRDEFGMTPSANRAATIMSPSSTASQSTTVAAATETTTTASTQETSKQAGTQTERITSKIQHATINEDLESMSSNGSGSGSNLNCHCNVSSSTSGVSSASTSNTSTPRLRNANGSTSNRHCSHHDHNNYHVNKAHHQSLTQQQHQHQHQHQNQLAQMIAKQPSQEEMQFSEGSLVHTLESAAEYVMKAERYELIPTLMSIAIPTYESQRNYEALAYAYKMCHDSCLKVLDVTRTGKRFLGTFYRVKFFGSKYFDDDDGREYIYKEPKVTSLAEISTRLQSLYNRKFGAENVELIMDSKEIDSSDLKDADKAFIQITYVTPAHSDGLSSDDTNDCEPDPCRRRVNYFEKNHNINRFSYETPFTLVAGRARSALPEEQYKRRTVLTTQSYFPYIKKRILVVDRQVKVLSPIEVAIDEMSARCEDLRQVVQAPREPGVPFDLKKLQLKLQGSISVQVNAGPAAYLRAFLDPHTIARSLSSSSSTPSMQSTSSMVSKASGNAGAATYSPYHIEKLKRIFREFICLCDEGLQINKQLIASDQQEYHVSMMRNYASLAQQVKNLDLNSSVCSAFIPILHFLTF